MASSRSNAANPSIPKKTTGRSVAELKVTTARRPRASNEVRAAGPPVLPGEDAKAYRGRLAAWTGDLGPRNEIETYLVERAVALSWQLDRVDRIQLAQLTQITGGFDPDQASCDLLGGSTVHAFDGSDVGGRLRDYQLACGQALFRTLDAFTSVRGLGDKAGTCTPASPTAAVVGEPASGVVVAPTVAVAPNPAPELATPARPVEADGAPDDSDGLGASHLPARRRSAGRRLIGGPPWTGSGGPQSTGSAACSAKARPIRRSDRQPEATPNPPDARRRVGGYAVPLDPEYTVTCADRIPVRLRRDAAAIRGALSAAYPSS